MRLTLTLICFLMFSFAFAQNSLKYSTTIKSDAYDETLNLIENVLGDSTSDRGGKKVWFLSESNFESTVTLKSRKFRIVYDGDDGEDKKKLEKLFREISKKQS